MTNQHSGPYRVEDVMVDREKLEWELNNIHALGAEIISVCCVGPGETPDTCRYMIVVRIIEPEQ